MNLALLMVYLFRFKSTKKDSAMQDGNPNLVFVRLTAGSDNNVVVSRVLSPEDTGATPYLMELQNILEEMVLLLTEATDDRNKYWNMRQRLNDRMQSLCKYLVSILIYRNIHILNPLI